MLAPYENSNQVNIDIIRNNLGLYYPNLSNRIYPDDVALYIGDYIKDYGTLIIQGYPNSYMIILWILSSDPIYNHTIIVDRDNIVITITISSIYNQTYSYWIVTDYHMIIFIRSIYMIIHLYFLSSNYDHRIIIPIVISQRIHGAGIYANMTGVYWWDPWHTINIGRAIFFVNFFPFSGGRKVRGRKEGRSSLPMRLTVFCTLLSHLHRKNTQKNAT